MRDLYECIGDCIRARCGGHHMVRCDSKAAMINARASIISASSIAGPMICGGVSLRLRTAPDNKIAQESRLFVMMIPSGDNDRETMVSQSMASVICIADILRKHYSQVDDDVLRQALIPICARTYREFASKVVLMVAFFFLEKSHPLVDSESRGAIMWMLILAMAHLTARTAFSRTIAIKCEKNQINDMFSWILRFAVPETSLAHPLDIENKAPAQSNNGPMSQFCAGLRDQLNAGAFDDFIGITSEQHNPTTFAITIRATI